MVSTTDNYSAGREKRKAHATGEGENYKARREKGRAPGRKNARFYSPRRNFTAAAAIPAAAEAEQRRNTMKHCHKSVDYQCFADSLRQFCVIPRAAADRGRGPITLQRYVKGRQKLHPVP